MKKFFEDNPLPILLAMLVVFAPPAFWIIKTGFAIAEDGGDPAFVAFLMVVTFCLILYIFSPVATIAVVILSFSFMAAGWIARMLFILTRKIIRLCVNKSRPA